MVVYILLMETSLRDAEYFQKAEGKMMKDLPAMSDGKGLKKLKVYRLGDLKILKG